MVHPCSSIGNNVLMRQSSVIVPTRGTGSKLEVFWSQRHVDLAFLGGFWAFAGGSLDPGDETLPLTSAPPRGCPGAAHYGCAARELFEEMGLLVTDRGVRHVSEDPGLRRLRELTAAPGEFAAALAARGERIDVERFLPLGAWVTPEWFEIGHDSEFFALHLTSDEDARFGDRLADDLLAAELASGEWIDPEEALWSWRAGTKLITPPIRYLLEAFAGEESVDDVELDADGVALTYDAWLATSGIYLVPLRSLTLPPATHTNCLIVGEDRFVVIDPGSPFEREQELLQLLLDQMVADGRHFEAVVLTHHHPDHIAGVEALQARYGAPLWAHGETASRVDFATARCLEQGDTIDLGPDSLECHHTPGHAPGHLCFFHPRTGGLIAGDLVASSGTILVNPPDGHMGAYLDSLQRMRDLAARTLYPAHGWVVTNPADRLDFYIRHRLQREDKVHAALVRFAKPATPADLVPDAYDDAPAAVWPLATRSAEAHLIHLVEIGRARRLPDERYFEAFSF